MPFVTYVRYGTRPSIEGAFNDIHHNMHVGNYGAAGGGVDNDDGSSW